MSAPKEQEMVDDANRVEREKILEKVRHEAQQKAAREWAASEEKVLREAEERGYLEGEERVSKRARSLLRFFPHLSLSSPPSLS